MVDYNKNLKKLVSALNADTSFSELNVYIVMYLIGTSQYAVAKATLLLAENKGLVKRQGKTFVVVGREKPTQKK